MTPGKEVEKPAATDVAELTPQEAALIAEQDAQYEGITLVVPLLKIGQALTREVQDGEAQAGAYINALTGDDLGDQVEFIVSGFHRGRFRSNDDGTYVAAGAIVPENWTDEADVPFIGQPFAEHPDAEETYKERVNNNDIEWGSGPPIQTTYNFTGYVVGHDVPVRLSLKSTHVKAARRWITLIRINRAPWDVVFDLTTEQQSNKSNQKFYVPLVSRGRNTDAQERAQAVELAQQLKDADTVREAGAGSDEADAKEAAKKAEAEAEEAGALGVK